MSGRTLSASHRIICATLDRIDSGLVWWRAVNSTGRMINVLILLTVTCWFFIFSYSIPPGDLFEKIEKERVERGKSINLIIVVFVPHRCALDSIANPLARQTTEIQIVPSCCSRWCRHLPHRSIVVLSPVCRQ